MLLDFKFCNMFFASLRYSEFYSDKAQFGIIEKLSQLAIKYFLRDSKAPSSLTSPIRPSRWKGVSAVSQITRSMHLCPFTLIRNGLCFQISFISSYSV